MLRWCEMYGTGVPGQRVFNEMKSFRTALAFAGVVTSCCDAGNLERRSPLM